MAWLPALSLAAFVIYMADHLGGWLSVRLSSFREDSVPSMKGKVVVVTGGNAGIGWHTVRLLAAAGAKVILACRAVQKGFEQVQTLPPEVAQQVEVMELDLAVFESIVAFSRRFQEKYQQLHVLVLNAGLAKTFLGSAGWKLTPEGLEEMSEIKQCYTLSSEKLGEGGFGYVTKGRSLETGSHYAVKKVSKAKAKQRRVQVRSEIDVMKLTDHPNVVTLHETFEDKSHLYLVMELCGGGDLDKHMQRQKGPYSEHQAAILMEQILKSVSYLHDCKGICHRDLKPHNFLFLRQADLCVFHWWIRFKLTQFVRLKLADFGLACSFQPGEVLSSKVGTVLYCSPQVLGGVYDSSADLWSCGVIMYMLLGHELPFSGKNDAEVAKSVRKGNYAFSDPVWLSVSEDGKDLIRKTLKFQPFDRATASQARQHVWFSFAAPELRSACALRASVLSDLLRFSARSAFQRAALRAVAMQLSQEEVEPLWRDFSALDVKGCGLVGAAELQERPEGTSGGNELRTREFRSAFRHAKPALKLKVQRNLALRQRVV
eukprot:g10014.t1